MTRENRSIRGDARQTQGRATCHSDLGCRKRDNRSDYAWPGSCEFLGHKTGHPSAGHGGVRASSHGRSQRQLQDCPTVRPNLASLGTCSRIRRRPRASSIWRALGGGVLLISRISCRRAPCVRQKEESPSERQNIDRSTVFERSLSGVYRRVSRR